MAIGVFVTTKYGMTTVKVADSLTTILYDPIVSTPGKRMIFDGIRVTTMTT